MSTESRPDTSEMVMRNPSAVCVTTGDVAAFLTDAKVATFLDRKESHVARAVWQVAGGPVPRPDLLSRIATTDFAVANSVINRLIEDRLLLVHSERVLSRILTPSTRRNRKCERLLVCMSGSIQSADFIHYLRALHQRLAQSMRLVLTQAACKFARPSSLAYLLDCDVFVDSLEVDPSSRRVLHIELAQWATMVLVAPATAATVSRIAHTASSDLLSQIIAALPAPTPLIIAPSMNHQMWTNDGVQQNIGICRRRGCWIIEPGFGSAVSDPGAKRLTIGSLGCDPTQLVELLERVLGGEFVVRD